MIEDGALGCHLLNLMSMGHDKSAPTPGLGARVNRVPAFGFRTRSIASLHLGLFVATAVAEALDVDIDLGDGNAEHFFD